VTEFGEPSRNMSVHLHEPVSIVSRTIESGGFCEAITFGHVYDFALYFSDDETTQLDNLTRLVDAARGAIHRIQVRQLARAYPSDTPLGIEDDKVGEEQ
jgi:hypothetical protein